MKGLVSSEIAGIARKEPMVKGLVKGFESTIAENDVFLHVIVLREKTWNNPSQPFTPSHDAGEGASEISGSSRPQDRRAAGLSRPQKMAGGYPQGVKRGR